MKRIIFIGFLLCIGKLTYAQSFEIKANPVLLPFNIWQLNFEYMVKEDIGIEPGIAFLPEADGGAIFSCLGKYYFSPSEMKNDRFHIGMFLNYITETDGPGIGFYSGYKWISKKRITFEIGGGIGRIIGESESGVTGLGQLTVGYRFIANKTK